MVKDFSLVRDDIPRDEVLGQGDARTLRTRGALRETLVSLLEQKPFEQVTIREIAAQAKIGYATFFRHYPSKDALLNDLAADQISGLMAVSLPMLMSADTRSTSRARFGYILEHRTIWSALLTGGAAGTVKAEFLRQMRQLAAEQGQFESWLPGDLRVTFAVASALEILAWWLEQEQVVDIDLMAEILDRLVVTPSLTDTPLLTEVEAKKMRNQNKS
jgi:AcrR family transcriptional regulator